MGNELRERVEELLKFYENHFHSWTVEKMVKSLIKDQQARIEGLEGKNKILLEALEWYAQFDVDELPIHEGEGINDDVDIGRTAKQALAAIKELG